MKAHGKIVDSEDLTPLVSGHIFVVDNNGEALKPSVMETTDEEGNFSIEVMPQDNILISYVGYIDKIVPISEFSSMRKEILVEYKNIASKQETQNREIPVEKGILEKRRFGVVTWLALGVSAFLIYKNWDKIKNYKF